MFKILLKYWYFALLAILFMICEVTVDMIQPKLMATIVDDGILGLSGNGQPDLPLIRHVGLIMILIVIAGGLSGMLSGTMANLCSQRFGNEIRKKCFDRIMHLSFEQTDAFTTGSLITRITNDVTQLERLVQQSVRGFVRCLMFMVVGTITLLSLNQHFLVILAIAFPLVLLDIIFILWRTNPLFMRLQRRIDSMNTVIRENISGARLVKAFIQEDREEGRFARANQALVKTQLRILILMSYLRPVMNIILNLATVALIWIGAIHVQRGGMQPGEVMAAVTYISQILNGMMMLAMIFQTLSRGTASYKRLREVLDTEPVIRDGAGAAINEDACSIPEDSDATGATAGAEGTEAGIAESASGTAALDHSVELREVTFRYPGREEGSTAQHEEKSTAQPAVDAVSRAAPALPEESPEPNVREESPEPDVREENPEPDVKDEGSVLRGVSLKIEDGEMLAIVGATGCGKSSLVSLIPRFYDATEGTVLVGGIDVRDYKVQELRDRIAFVPQKNELFSTTIRENILIGRPDASDKAVRFAARCAQAEQFILEQPQGFDTPVAEGGMSLSGGQRQRIAIARALLKTGPAFVPKGGPETGGPECSLETGGPECGPETGGPECGPETGGPECGPESRPAACQTAAHQRSAGILILDDSTSALDLKTEAAFYDALRAHYDGLTCIVIAQRITTARRADRIAVMDHGRLVGCGTHEELLDSCAVYRDIYRSQAESDSR